MSRHDLVILDQEGSVQLTLQNTTLSVMILDRSGSMAKFGKAPIQAVNSHLAGIKDAPPGSQQFCSVVSFADHMRVEIPLGHALQIRPMERFNAGGNTLLWETVDAVLGNLLSFIGKLDPQLQKRLKVTVGVISDGEDNRSSKRYYPERLRETSANAQAMGWELLVFGIGVDAESLARDMGFPTDKASAHTFEATEEGLAQSSVIMTQSTLGGGWRQRE